jgi:hypothetical protein
VPGIAVIAAAAVGVLLTAPEAAHDCPVIGGREDSAPELPEARITPR